MLSLQRRVPCRGRSRRMCPCHHAEAESDEFDRTVGSQLASDGEARDEKASGDHDAVVGASRDELGQRVPPHGELLDDSKQFVHLEVVDRRLTVRTTLGGELAIQVLEELLRGADRPAVWAYGFWEASAAAICASTSARTRARNAGGTSSRSFTMLAWNSVSTSAGVISSSSAAVQSLRGIEERLSLASLSNKGLV